MLKCGLPRYNIPEFEYDRLFQMSPAETFSTLIPSEESW